MTTCRAGTDGFGPVKASESDGLSCLALQLPGSSGRCEQLEGRVSASPVDVYFEQAMFLAQAQRVLAALRSPCS